MASSIGIDGLISGLKTSDIIDQLMAVEGNQQSLLASKKSGLSSLATALQSLNTKVASLTTAATNAKSADSWQATTATSSSTSVTAVTSTGAQPSAISLTVDKIAASQSTLYTLPTSYSADKPQFTLTIGGEETTITALSSNIGDITAAFNASGTGVTASSVNVGTKDAPVYRLQLTGSSTGTANAFTLTADNPNDGTSLGAQEIRVASDAKVTLWPGTAGETSVTSESNTFTGLITGVDLTVSKESADPVTVTVARSSGAMSTLAQNLVTNLNAVLGDITDRTKSTSSTASDGGTVLSGGLFSGNSGIRLLQQNLLDVGSISAGGKSAASVGIVLNKDGTFTFDAAVFATSYSADPEATQAVVQKIAAALEGTGTAASDSKSGTITSQITSNQEEVDDLADRIADWDTRLADRRASLVKIYAAMEVSLSKMQSTSNYLTQQIAQLNSSNSSS